MARNRTVTIEELPDAISKILKEYEGEINSEMPTIIRKVAQKGVQAMKSSASVFKGTGAYAKGWGYKFEPDRLRPTAKIHNKKLPGLPHLLEYGHANRNGGRTPGKVHIAPVEEKINRELEEKIRHALQ